VFAYLKRLATTGAAYQAADVAAKGVAIVTLPIYTRHLGTGAYGAADTLLTAVILTSIFLRAGLGEAFVRFYYDDEDRARRTHVARTTAAAVVWMATAVALIAVVLARPLSRFVLGYDDPPLMQCAILGLWAFTNLEIAYAQLRVDERARTYLIASATNVALTVLFTVLLVVVANQGARGLLLGNFGASALVVVGLWWTLRHRVSLRVPRGHLRSMLRFGLPTVPADASVYALQVVDRIFLFRVVSHSSAGLYSVAIKLATVVFVAVRGFQYAWPPLAYSITSDEEASRLYSLVTTYFVLATGVVVVGVALLGRWLVRLLAAPNYFGAHRALPWLALGWSLYGLYLVFVVIAGRARVTARALPAAMAGLASNVLLIVLLVPRAGAGLGIAGAGIALCGSYVVMLVVMHLLTRSVFHVGFEWRRLALLVAILGGVAVSGDLLLPTSGVAGFVLRTAWLALIPALLVATHFFTSRELIGARALLAAGRRRARELRAGGVG
jgi:O-antigen/teichoic acid export membrane protein